MSQQPLHIALLHPGAMGSAIGACLTAAGHHVGWCASGRSDESRRRAEQALLTPFSNLADLLSKSDAVIPVCPPHGATKLAEQVATIGFTGLYLDANAVAPGTSATIAAMIERGGGRYADGGIVGPPPTAPGTTRLYLSGDHAEELKNPFADSPLDVSILRGARFSASALKLCYAAWTKGSAALLMATAAAAREAGVSEDLYQEWALSQPELGARLQRETRQQAEKAWRFEGEMTEIAEFFDAVKVDSALPSGAARIYAQLARLAECPEAGESALEAVLDELAGNDSVDNNAHE